MKAEVQVENLSTDLSQLMCPNCGDGYLHQGIVEVYNRSESAEQVRCTVIDRGDVLSQLIPNDESNNPSTRRHGIVIHFECEHCGDTDFQLRIAQHKGFTLMDWEYEHGSDTGSEG
jgi:predicted RNA-binding Zn-ribbon protein involved in translation (DUF1610 family)